MVVELSGRPAAPTDSLQARPLVPTVATLATSDTVVQNVAADARQLAEGGPVAPPRFGGARHRPVPAQLRGPLEGPGRARRRAGLGRRVLARHRALPPAPGGSTAVETDPPRTTPRCSAVAARRPAWGVRRRAGGLRLVALVTAQGAPATGIGERDPSGFDRCRRAELLERRTSGSRRQAAEFDEAQVLSWEAYLDELEAQAAGGALPANLEKWRQDSSRRS